MTRTFGLVVASAVDLPMRDTQCGFKAFHGSVAKLLFHGAQVDSFAFDIEVLTRAARLGLRTEEVPVRWTEVSGSKVHVIKDSLEMLIDISRTRWRRQTDTPIHGVALTDTDPWEGAALLRSRCPGSRHGAVVGRRCRRPVPLRPSDRGGAPGAGDTGKGAVVSPAARRTHARNAGTGRLRICSRHRMTRDIRRPSRGDSRR